MKIALSVMEDLTLNDSEKKDLQKEASLPGLYCQGCRQCLGQCPEHLPIPDLMRAYMYTYGYRNLGLAQDLLLSLNLPTRVCEDCSLCPVKCLIGFNVSRKIKDVVRLREVPTEFIG
jgi:ferredoxin